MKTLGKTHHGRTISIDTLATLKRGAFAAVSFFCFALILFRMVLDGYYLLPAPVADSILFLDSAHNLCSQNFLGSALVPLDPKGLNRYVWHGFLSPWLYGSLSKSCSVQSYFAFSIALKLICLVLAYTVSRFLNLPKWQAISISLLVLMVDYKFGFRPEPLAIIFIFAIELFILRERLGTAAVLASALLWTQPTVFGLYSIYVALSRPELLRVRKSITPIVFFSISTIFFAILYPYPAQDLIEGIRSHAVKIGHRGDGDLWTYYGFTDFSPLWFLIFIVGLGLSIARKPFLTLLLPALWWFGPRLPPTNYNLLALLPIIVLHGFLDGGRWASRALTMGAMSVAIVGLAQGCLRDGATSVKYGRTFEAARDRVLDDARNPNVTLKEIPAYGRLWFSGSAKIGSGPIDNAKHEAQKSNPIFISYFSVTTTPIAPCPEESPDIRSIYFLGQKFFNSTSGWQIYRCTENNP